MARHAEEVRQCADTEIFKSGRYKQKMILEAMRDAFLRGPYAEITVSGLIRQAGISRASFYTYFDGKDDMFSCMLRSMEGETEEMLLDSFRRQKGVFNDSMAGLFRLLTENDVGRMYSQVGKHILEDEAAGRRSYRWNRSITGRENGRAGAGLVLKFWTAPSIRGWMKMGWPVPWTWGCQFYTRRCCCILTNAPGFRSWRKRWKSSLAYWNRESGPRKHGPDRKEDDCDEEENDIDCGSGRPVGGRRNSLSRDQRNGKTGGV